MTSRLCACREKGKTSHFKLTALNDRDDTDDEKYWKCYPGVVSQKKERLWDALVDGLEKYQ